MLEVKSQQGRDRPAADTGKRLTFVRKSALGQETSSSSTGLVKAVPSAVLVVLCLCSHRCLGGPVPVFSPLSWWSCACVLTAVLVVLCLCSHRCLGGPVPVFSPLSWWSCACVLTAVLVVLCLCSHRCLGGPVPVFSPLSWWSCACVLTADPCGSSQWAIRCTV